MTSEDKNARILYAAEDVFSRKGFLGASVAEIARLAQVTDFLIYQYVMGKEDLLFSIPEKRIIQQITLLEEGLEGIRDLESLLSKMIWFHLRRNETDGKFACLLLLEYHSNKDFYSSAAYAGVREYSSRMLHILEQSVKEGFFRDDVDMQLMRDVIFGTIDFKVLSYLVTREISEPSVNLDYIMALILPMIRTRRESRSRSVDKASRILMAAESFC